MDLQVHTQDQNDMHVIIISSFLRLKLEEAPFVDMINFPEYTTDSEFYLLIICKNSIHTQVTLPLKTFPFHSTYHTHLYSMASSLVLFFFFLHHFFTTNI